MSPPNSVCIEKDPLNQPLECGFSQDKMEHRVKNNRHFPDLRDLLPPRRPVQAVLGEFFIARYEVTNELFETFVDARSYVTQAEQLKMQRPDAGIKIWKDF